MKTYIVLKSAKYGNKLTFTPSEEKVDFGRYKWYHNGILRGFMDDSSELFNYVNENKYLSPTDMKKYPAYNAYSDMCNKY